MVVNEYIGRSNVRKNQPVGMQDDVFIAPDDGVLITWWVKYQYKQHHMFFLTEDEADLAHAKILLDLPYDKVKQNGEHT